LSSEFRLIIFTSETDPVEDLSRLRPLNPICEVADSLIIHLWFRTCPIPTVFPVWLQHAGSN